MTTRRKKHLKGKVSGSVKKHRDNRIGRYLNELLKDKGEIKQRVYDIENLQDLIMTNIYHFRCLEQNIECTVGKGYSEDTDPEIVENIPLMELVDVVREAMYYGDPWVELTFLDGKLVNLLSIPTMNTNIGDGKYKGKLIQFYGKENQTTLDILDIEEYKNGKIKNGVYAYQIQEMKFGRKVYGFPKWIPAMELLKIMKYSIADISAFYENDCIPYTMLISQGVGMTTQDGEDMVDFLERQFQGAKEKRKVSVINLPQPKDISSIEVKELQKKIVDSDYLAFIKENKTDICTMNEVPAWMLGINKSGSLGNTQEREVELGFYLSEKIGTERRGVKDFINTFYPDKEVDFLNIEMPAVETQEPDFGFMESAKSQIRNSIKDVLSEYEINSMRPNK